MDGAFSTDEPHAIEAVFPWLAFLNPADRDECLRELREVGAAATESAQPGRLCETVYAWQATALAAWDEQRQRKRVGYTNDDPLDLPRPVP